MKGAAAQLRALLPAIPRTAVVLGSGLPVRVIGLDVTDQIALPTRDLDEGLFGESELGRCLEQVLRALAAAEQPTRGESAPLAIGRCRLVGWMASASRSTRSFST